MFRARRRLAGLGRRLRRSPRTAASGLACRWHRVTAWPVRRVDPTRRRGALAATPPGPRQLRSPGDRSGGGRRAPRSRRAPSDRNGSRARAPPSVRSPGARTPACPGPRDQRAIVLAPPITLRGTPPRPVSRFARAAGRAAAPPRRADRAHPEVRERAAHSRRGGWVGSASGRPRVRSLDQVVVDASTGTAWRRRSAASSAVMSRWVSDSSS
jgi:hypothetical protein